MTLQAIAHYQITAKLGEGGVGEVYRAIDTKFGCEFAISSPSRLLKRDSLQKSGASAFPTNSAPR